jgi:hypothetical protein
MDYLGYGQGQYLAGTNKDAWTTLGGIGQNIGTMLRGSSSNML